MLALTGGLFGLLSLAAVPESVAGASGSVNAELAQAKSELLSKADLPGGWSAQGSVATHTSDTGASSIPGLQQLGSCLGLSGSQASVLTESTPEVDSPSFSDNANSVSETIDIRPSVKQANEAYHDSTLAKVPSCFSSLFSQPAAKSEIESSFGEGSTLGTVTAGFAPKKDLIANTSGVVLEFPLTQQGQTYDVVLGLVDWARGSENPTLSFTSVNGGFPSTLAKRLETAAYNKS